MVSDIHTSLARQPCRRTRTDIDSILPSRQAPAVARLGTSPGREVYDELVFVVESARSIRVKVQWHGNFDSPGIDMQDAVLACVAVYPAYSTTHVCNEIGTLSLSRYHAGLIHVLLPNGILHRDTQALHRETNAALQSSR